MELGLHSASGEQGSQSLEVADQSFGVDFNEGLVHQVVTAYLAAARSGTRAQKSRAQVRGGGAKPWRQKGMGRARAGSSRNPLWRSGGVTFAASPRNYAQKVNRKMYRGAMRCIVSELVREQRLVVIEDFALQAPKTRELLDRLKSLELDEVLIVTDGEDENLGLASRNLYGVGALTANQVSSVDLIGFAKVLITVPALRRLEERLA